MTERDKFNKKWKCEYGSAEECYKSVIGGCDTCEIKHKAYSTYLLTRLSQSEEKMAKVREWYDEAIKQANEDISFGHMPDISGQLADLKQIIGITNE